jgi:hypothetical protein
MDASEFFQSKGTYLNASHLNGAQVDVTILNVQQEEVGKDRERKLVVYFAEIDRGLVLNKTNYGVLEPAYGRETEGWHGKKATIYPDKTEFDGKEVDCVRLRVDPNNYVPQSQWPKPKPAPRAEMDDQIPFS